MPDAAAPLTTRFTRQQRRPLLVLSCAVMTPLVALLLGGGLAMLALKTVTLTLTPTPTLTLHLTQPQP